MFHYYFAAALSPPIAFLRENTANVYLYKVCIHQGVCSSVAFLVDGVQGQEITK